MNTAVAGSVNQTAREFLSFKLAAEDYAVPILQVQEIKGYDSITRLPEAPSHIKGIINLRGTIVPIIELRTLLKLGAPAYDANTVMIVVNVGGRVVGLVVDSVSDVVAVTQLQIAPTPELGGMAGRRYVSGLATLDSRLIILLNPDILLSMNGGEMDTAIGSSAIAA